MERSVPKVVLLVEDDDIYRKIIVEFLKQLNMITFQAGNGHEALAILAKNKVDIIVTDLVMPLMDGIDLITRLRASKSKLPIIAVSGTSASGRGPSLEMAKAAGATLTLDKPFPFSDLADAITGLTTRP